MAASARLKSSQEKATKTKSNQFQSISWFTKKYHWCTTNFSRISTEKMPKKTASKIALSGASAPKCTISKSP